MINTRQFSTHQHTSTKKQAYGFTFIELVLVLVIVGLLISVALPRYFAGVERSKEAVLKEDLKIMREAIDHYHADKGVYPLSLDDLVQQKYLRTIPPDPLTERADTWELIAAQEQPAGVADVRSGANMQAADGSNYSDW